MLVDDVRFALDPVAFALINLHFQPDLWQARVLRAAEKRILLNCSRQVGKSTVAAIMALHRVLFFPSSLVLLVSPSLRQSSELFRKVTEFMNRLPSRPKLLEENKLSLQLENRSRVVSLPGDESTIRGYSRASLAVEDEGARVPDDVYKSIRPMLAVGGGRLVVLSTPCGQRGHFYEAWQGSDEGWLKVRIPAKECPRITATFLEQEKNSLGRLWFEQEYDCRFLEVSNQLFKHDEIVEALDDKIQPLALF